jgi:hypothetical protein
MRVVFYEQYFFQNFIICRKNNELCESNLKKPFMTF